jgi:hypothetical protein
VIDEQFHQYQQIHLSLQLIGHKKKIMTCDVENPAHGVEYTQISRYILEYIPSHELITLHI